MNVVALRISNASLSDMLSFPDMYGNLHLAGNEYLFGIVKRGCRSKNGILVDNVFFVSHVINRRHA